jgi:hypothetical protein
MSKHITCLCNHRLILGFLDWTYRNLHLFQHFFTPFLKNIPGSVFLSMSLSCAFVFEAYFNANCRSLWCKDALPFDSLKASRQVPFCCSCRSVVISFKCCFTCRSCASNIGALLFQFWTQSWNLLRKLLATNPRVMQWSRRLIGMKTWFAVLFEPYLPWAV